MQQCESTLNVAKEADCVGQENDIERPGAERLDRRYPHDSATPEFEMRMALSGESQCSRAEIDADPFRGPQARQEIAVAAAELQHPDARSDQELQIAGILIMEIAVPLPPRLEIRRQPLCGIVDRPFAGAHRRGMGTGPSASEWATGTRVGRGTSQSRPPGMHASM